MLKNQTLQHPNTFSLHNNYLEETISRRKISSLKQNKTTKSKRTKRFRRASDSGLCDSHSFKAYLSLHSGGGHKKRSLWRIPVQMFLRYSIISIALGRSSGCSLRHRLIRSAMDCGHSSGTLQNGKAKNQRQKILQSARIDFCAE